MTCDLYRTKLEPYVDAELSADEVREVEKHLRTCAVCASDALGRVQMKQNVRAVGARYSPSVRFRLQVEERIKPKRNRLWAHSWIPKLAAAAAMVLLVVLAGVWMRDAKQKRALTEFADLHVTALASSNPVDVVSTDRHTVKPWFVGKLPFTFNLPEFQGSPFTLLGGRLVYFGHTPGAQLLFEVRKHRLSLFVLQDNRDAVPLPSNRMVQRELAFNTESWAEDGLRYVVISDAGPEDVRAFGELLQSASRSNAPARE